ncbi:oligosaccharide flippase family protein [Patescibacteria group bacterium]|nr:oligosaccharide flippase family protein [Patescibacteria group bacterium]
MKSLVKWQLISFVSRSIATVLGIIQGAIVFRILTQTEFGLKELALSIGGALGIYQHLGLASATTREIAAAEDDSEIFKIFVTSVFARYCVTIPLAIGLYMSSGYVSRKYPGLELPLKLYAFSLLFQGMQSILNAVISGTKRFKHLFIYQVVIAFVSVILYVPLVYFFRVAGFFHAFLAFNIVSTVSLAFLAFRPLKGKMKFPSWKDFKRLLKEIFSISIAIYVVKVLYTNWEKLGNNLLGLFVSAEAVALFGFAMIFAKKLMLISDSVTDVNLPVLSEKYKKDISDFKRTFISNFNKVFSVVIIAASLGTYWAPQVVIIYGGLDKYYEYQESLKLVPPLIMSFVIYSFINIVMSSILVPAKLVRSMIVGFTGMLLGTGGAFLLGRVYFNILHSMAWAMVIGAAGALLYLKRVVKRKLDFNFLTDSHILLFIQTFAICILGSVEYVWIKVGAFLPLSFLLCWGILTAGFISKEEYKLLINKARGFIKCRNIRA